MKPRLETMTADELKTYVHYDPITGVFKWAKRGGKGLRIRQGAAIESKATNGYLRVCINKRFFQLHRLAWLYMTGEWPLEDIDHFNGVRDDNKWANLRSVSRAINLQNMSGVNGYQPTRNKKRFTARIQTNKETIYLGTFDTADAARTAYLEAKRLYHPGTRYD